MEFEFTTYRGMVVLGDEEAAAEHLQRLEQAGQALVPWRFERGFNHVHADIGQPDRMLVRQEYEYADALENALRRAYPERAFVISHIPGYAVSFFQQAEGAPVEDIPPTEPPDETVFCFTCQRCQPYTPGDEPDREFPKAEWGRCPVCGEEVIVRHGEVLRVVTPAGGD